MRLARPLMFAALLLVSLQAVVADENPRMTPGVRTKQYFVFTPSHSLTADEQAQLRADGIQFEHNLTGGRYLVAATDSDVASIEGRGLGTTDRFTPALKIAPAARRSATSGGLNARFTLIFHDDVTFDEARNAIAAAGGVIETPLTTGFGAVKMLTVRMPGGSLNTIASDNRVMTVAGPPLHPVADNAIAASLSSVTPLYSAPYNLTGNGVVLSLFELGKPDTAHVEFNGRLTSHITSGSTDAHSTHVAGTMAAAGVNAAAKGMSPGAQAIHLFDANVDGAVLFNDKQVTAPGTGSVADNNSWGFQLGWQSGASRPVWYGCFACIGGYDGTYDTNIDKIARTSTTLYVHSAGNDGFSGKPGLSAADYSAHQHTDDNTGDVITNETFCYSKDGSGTDCPAATCTPGMSSRSTDDNGDPLLHCETVKHPTYGPFTTLGLVAGSKNVIAVGALDVTKTGTNLGIAEFSSRGPTTDGRVKPDLVAKGTNQYSSLPGNAYGYNQGTSMSSPVVTGVAGLMVEQWRKTFGKSPTPQQLKTLLIAGADDQGNPGPDFTMGFGLVDAKASADLIIADANQGNRIRNGTLSQGQTQEYSVTLPSAQSKLRVVLAWADPEVFTLGADALANKTLINDLDVSVLGPDGSTTLPYVLDAAHPDTNATRGVNTVDNIEEVEIANAAAGTYRIAVKATKIGDTRKSTQDFVVIANALVGTAAPICSDSFSAYNSTSNAFGDVPNGSTYSSKFCGPTAVDFFKYNVTAAGTVRITVTAGDTPITVTEFNAAGGVIQSQTIAAGQTATLTKTYSTNPNAREFVAIAPAGALGASPSYSVTFQYPFTTPARHRPTHH